MNHIVKLFLIAVAMVTAIPSFAVTDSEMEQARTMAAKHYLRYANNGSDYLDKLNPASMGELTKALKAKELENIKSFNAVAVPKDYASWDKAKLVDYWSNTFFKSPGLKEDGKKCLGILGKNLGKITVKAQAPAAAAQEKQQPERKPQPEATQSAALAQSAPAATPDPQPSEEQLAAESEAMAAEEQIEEERQQKSSGTGWYVAILVVLVGVVVWLVMYAQKSMKETGQVVAQHREGEKEIRDARRAAKEEVNRIRDQYAASVAAKNDEIKQLRSRCESLEEEVESLKAALARKTSQPQTQAQTQAQPQAQPRPQAPAKASAEERVRESQPRKQTSLPPVVYLGYVNQRGLFVKASRSLNEENSVYRMDIPDGTHGSYRVVNDASILDRLLSDPTLWLEGGCTIDNPEDADIATEIVTIEPGQALFADNTCRVERKARIKFI